MNVRELSFSSPLKSRAFECTNESATGQLVPHKMAPKSPTPGRESSQGRQSRMYIEKRKWPQNLLEEGARGRLNTREAQAVQEASESFGAAQRFGRVVLVRGLLVI